MSTQHFLATGVLPGVHGLEIVQQDLFQFLLLPGLWPGDFVCHAQLRSSSAWRRFLRRLKPPRLACVRPSCFAIPTSARPSKVPQHDRLALRLGQSAEGNCQADRLLVCPPAERWRRLARETNHASSRAEDWSRAASRDR